MQHHWDYIYEPDAQLIEGLITRFIESQHTRAQNGAREQAAKRIAMKNATENAGELSMS